MGLAADRIAATTTMQILLVVLLASILSCSRVDRAQDMRERDASPREVAGAIRGVQLIAELPNGEWRLPAGDFANTRFSLLSQIHTGNVANLKIAMTVSTGINRGHEGQPLVVNGTIYVVTPFPNLLYAIDLSKPGGER